MAYTVCGLVFVLGIVLLWKEPPQPPEDDDNADVLRRMDGDRNWDDFMEGWT